MAQIDIQAIRSAAKRIRKEKLSFNSEHLGNAPNVYVGWIDLMGSGHAMSTSVQKTANAIARLHLAVETAREQVKFSGKTLAVNDGIFIVCPQKRSFMSLLGQTMVYLAANFVAVPRPHDRFLLRGGIAYGPVYYGDSLTVGLKTKKLRDNSGFLSSLMFGPALINAYRAESLAPPYGIAIDESARAFYPPAEQPFRMTHWMWWSPNEDVDYGKGNPPLSPLKDCLYTDLDEHFDWLRKSMIYNGLDEQRIDRWREMSAQYFALA